MKRIVPISISFLLSITLYSQVIRIDSIKVYHQNFILDSIQLSLSSKVQNIDTIVFNDSHLANPCSVPYFFGLAFKGCTTNNYSSIDTTYIFQPQTAWAPALNIITCWDTSSICTQPSFFTCTDTLLWRPCFPTNLKELETLRDLIIYPNPAKDWIQIESSEKIQSITVYSNSGQMVLESKTASTKIEVSSLENGIYFIQVQFESGISQSQKILIQR